MCCHRYRQQCRRKPTESRQDERSHPGKGMMPPYRHFAGVRAKGTGRCPVLVVQRIDSPPPLKSPAPGWLPGWPPSPGLNHALNLEHQPSASTLSAALAVCHANIYQHLPTQFQVFAGSPRQTDLLIGGGSSLAMPSAGNANRVCSLDAGSTSRGSSSTMTTPLARRLV